MKLKGIKIKAFRLFDNVDLSFVNHRFADKGCANFVSIYAPNGFGKTSLFDAIEFGMTSNIRRLKLSNFTENIKYENKLSDGSSFIHNKKMPGQDIHIRLDLENYNDGFVDRVIKQDEEQALLTGDGENKFFSEAILSQDWFSEFLSVNSAEMRFKIFMENFHESQDLLEYHSQLKSTLTSLNREKGNLGRELANLKKKLTNDVDEHIVERIDAMVGCLKDLEIKVDWKQKIDADSLAKLSMEAEQVMARVNNMKSLADSALENCEKLRNGQEGLVALGRMAEHLKNIEAVGKQIEDLKQKLSVVVKLKNLIALIEKLGKEKNNYVNSLARLQKLVEKYPLYKQYQTVIETKSKEITACNNEMTAFDNQISEQEKERCTKEETRQKQNSLLAVIENKIKSLKADYAKYQACLKEIGDKQKEKTVLLEKITGLKSDIDVRNKSISRLREIQQIVYGKKVDVEIEGYGELSKKIVTLSQNISKRISEIDNLTKSIEQQTAYQNQVSQLVSRSREMVGELKTGVCPLCGHDYTSVELLLEGIEKNNVVSAAITQAIAQRESLNDDNKRDQQERDNTYQVFEKAIDDAVNLAWTGLKELEGEYERQNAAIREAANVIIECQRILDSEYAGFKDLTKEQLQAQYDERKGKLTADIQALDKAVEEYDKTIGALSEKRKTIDDRRQEAQKVITVTRNREDYLEYQSLLGNDTADDVSLLLWNVRISELKDTIAQYDKQVSEANEECLTLKEVQHADLSNDVPLSEELKKKNSEKEGLEESYYKTLQFMKNDCKVIGIEKDTPVEEVVKLFEAKRDQHRHTFSISEKRLTLMADYLAMLGIAVKYNQQQLVKNDIEETQGKIKKNSENITAVAEEIERLQKYLEDYVKNFFQVDRIQYLYNMIDPHPDYKEIKFDCDFSLTRPRLNVYMKNREEGNDSIVPTLYFSTAQINILSFCIFMAKALFAKTDDGQDVGCVFIDDPIQALDDINILSMIDLLRNVAFSLNRQIVMTTHDQNFFELLQKKIPQTKFNSCYVELVERGKFKIKTDE